jgi:hypothetical protein
MGFRDMMTARDRWGFFFRTRYGLALMHDVIVAVEGVWATRKQRALLSEMGAKGGEVLDNSLEMVHIRC